MVVVASLAEQHDLPGDDRVALKPTALGTVWHDQVETGPAGRHYTTFVHANSPFTEINFLHEVFFGANRHNNLSGLGLNGSTQAWRAPSGEVCSASTLIRSGPSVDIFIAPISSPHGTG